jgi:hypothetical protein
MVFLRVPFMDEEVEESAEETTGESTGESSGAGMQGSCGKLKLNGTVQFYKMSVVREPAFGQVIFWNPGLENRNHTKKRQNLFRSRMARGFLIGLPVPLWRRRSRSGCAQRKGIRPEPAFRRAAAGRGQGPFDNLLPTLLPARPCRAGFGR